jgi:hypothetical protein
MIDADAARFGWPRTDIAKTGTIIALSAWVGNHKTIYSTDPDLLNELSDSDLPEGLMPSEIFRRLPHQAPLIVLQEPIIVEHDGVIVQYSQFFVLTFRFTDSTSEVVECAPHEANMIRFLWVGTNVENDNDFMTVSQTLDLRDSVVDLHQELDLLADKSKRFLEGTDLTAEEIEILDRQLPGKDSQWETTSRRMFPLAVLLIMYACSESPDIEDVSPSVALSSRGGYKGRDLSIKDLGLRIGSALRTYRGATGATSEATGRSVTPHLRKAHWHRFWTGPRDGERTLVLRWLPPIPVNLHKGEIVSTIHPMRKTA